jgi:hypothetical protein
LADPQQLEGHLADVRKRLIARVDDMSAQRLLAGSVDFLVAEILNEDTYEPAEIEYDAAMVELTRYEGRDYIHYKAPCTESVSWTGGTFDDHWGPVDAGPYPYRRRKTYEVIGGVAPNRAAWQGDMETAVTAVNNLIDDHYQKLETALKDRVAARKRLAKGISEQAAADGLSIETIRDWAKVQLGPSLTMISLSAADRRVEAGASISEVTTEIRDSIVEGIRRFGTALEESTPGLPAILIDQGEEQMRELLLVGLRMQYGGAVTAESYVRRGKTDLLVRWRDTSVFIAELKIYKGPAAVTSAINQLFGYIPVRGDHGALVVFIKGAKGSENRERQTLAAVRRHKLCIRPAPGKVNEFEFQHADDPDRKINLAVVTIIVDDPRDLKGRLAAGSSSTGEPGS